jgi:hypothetical protein
MFPAQLVTVIDQLFPNARAGTKGQRYTISAMHSLQGLLNLLQQIPNELLAMTPEAYSDFVLSVATIQAQIEHWDSRGEVGFVADVKGQGPVGHCQVNRGWQMDGSWARLAG